MFVKINIVIIIIKLSNFIIKKLYYMFLLALEKALSYLTDIVNITKEIIRFEYIKKFEN